MKMDLYGSRWLWFLAIIIVLLATRGLYLFPRDPANLSFLTIAGHEWEYNLWRILGMSSALADGMPGRWLEAYSHGWGYPLFHYTGPLPYTLGGGLYLLGFEIHAALNICWFIAYAGSGLAMFWAMRRIVGDWGALLATTCYLFAPYHLVDTYVRTNLVETSAFIFPPLVLYGLWLSQTNPVRGVFVGAIGISLIPLTHLLSTYLIGVALAVFCITYLILLPLKNKLQFFMCSALIGVLGLGLSAFFWLPAVVDTGAIKGMNAITAGFYTYTNHFVYPKQLISQYWGYGGSDPGPNDYMSLGIGRYHALLVLATLVCFAWLSVRVWLQKRGNLTDAKQLGTGLTLPFAMSCLVAGVFSGYLTLYSSEWLWKIIPSIEVAQFPWRFLFPTTFFLCAFIGFLPSVLRRCLGGFALPLTMLLVVAVIYLQWNFAKAGSYAVSEDVRLERDETVKFGLWTTNQHEFLPSTTRLPWGEAARRSDGSFYGSDLIPENRIAKSTIVNGRANFQLKPGDSGTLILNQHWHPAWHASADGKPIATRAFSAHPFGVVAVDLPANTTFVEFRYGMTGAARAGWWLTLTLLLIGSGYLIKSGRTVELRKPGIYLGLLFGYLVFLKATAAPHTQSLEDRTAQVSKTVSAKQYSTVKRRGLRWDDPSNVTFSEKGLRVKMGEVSHAAQINLSTDSNDRYQVVFSKGRKVLGVKIIPQRYVGGLSSYTLVVPEQTVTVGFDTITLVPISGDGFYSLGHVVTEVANSEEDAGIQTVTAHRVEPETVSYSELPLRTRRGSPWDSPGNRTFSNRGLDILLENVRHARRIEIASDSNDNFLVGLFNADTLVATLDLLTVEQYRGRGMNIYRLDVSEAANQKGFDKIRMIPTLGDGRYSVGHVRIVD